MPEPSSPPVAAPIRLVTETRAEFREALLRRIEDPAPGPGPLLIDLARTVEIDASGLAVLVVAQRTARARDRSLCLVGAGREVRNMLSCTHLDALFDFMPALPEVN
ncbi:MAG: STAS domain-containing protein [Gemmatimonadota bacterium]